MKKCTKCGLEKPPTDYFFKDKQKGRLHAQCKLCYQIHRQTYSREHYLKYGNAYRERAKQRRALIKKDLQDQMLLYLRDKSCAVCDESDVRVPEFDHLNPSQKSFSISKGITDGLKWEKILTEISKCRILCANCHKRHTAIQYGWHKSIAE